MKGSTAHNPILRVQKAEYRCLSCGTTEHMGKRRYCSVKCRQNLRQQLNRRTGLLKTLTTRWAAFYFSNRSIFLDVLPYHSVQIYSFWYQRTNGKTPAEDFCRLADQLGNTWWAEIKRTQKRYLANKHLLKQSLKKKASAESVKPLEVWRPAVGGQSFLHLKLGRADLHSPALKQLIKEAYRREAFKHHPDYGGDPAAFLKVQQAYEQLISWAENPSFVKRRGFPDKWFYDGEKNRWVQPVAAPKAKT